MISQKNRPPRANYTPEVEAEIRSRLERGEYQHDIAADLGWNQGRISEIKTGKRQPPPIQASLL